MKNFGQKNKNIFATIALFAILSLSLLFIDLPLATWIGNYLKVNFPLARSSNIPDTLFIIVVILTILSWMGNFYLTRLKIFDQRTYACRITGTILPISYGLKVILKWLFGRTDTRTWLSDPSQYGFHLFAGTEGSQGFPSGHMLVFSPLFMVLWQLYPRYRLYCVALWILLGTSLVLTEYHFLSDVLAGAYVGVFLYFWVSARVNKFNR